MITYRSGYLTHGVTDDLKAVLFSATADATCRRTHILQEDLENTAGLLVDETGNTLYTATTSKTTDSL